MLASCDTYNKVTKSIDRELKYESAKRYYMKKKYGRSARLMEDIVLFMKGTSNAEESLFLLAMTYFKQKDYSTAAQYFRTYYTTYPRGSYTEEARFYAGRSLFLDSPETQLDQTQTYVAIQELQMFMEFFPQSRHKDFAQQMQFDLQDKLVYKDYLSAKLYYDLGDYMGNNYLSCIVTAQNALRDYPYTHYREDLSILILRARYELATHSIDEKRTERYRETVDEFYAFVNEFPDSKYMKEATSIFRNSEKYIND